MQLQDLEVDGRPHPLGTRTSGLRFTWRFGAADDDRPEQRQDWWSIRITTPDGDVWDSGRAPSPSPWAVLPDDVRLAAWHEHAWSLTVGIGDAELTASGTFVPAPEHEDDWHGARWIGRTTHDADSADDRSPRTRARSGEDEAAAPILAIPVPEVAVPDLTVPDVPVRRALLAVAAGGHADVLVDGVLATDEVLSPGTTHWDRRVEVVLHDLAPALAGAGPHELGFHLGRGFAGMTNPNVWAWERAPWHAEPSVRAVLRLEHTDGSTSVLTTGPDWTCQAGPILLDDLYAGEVVDLRRRTGGTHEAAREPAALVPGPAGRLEARLEQPSRVVEELAPTSVAEASPGVWVIGFPRVIAGWVRIAFPASEPGTRVELRYGERLRDDGLPNADDENGYFRDGFQTDEVVLDGTATTWEPRFSYKGFRYVQVSGWPADAPAPEVVARVVRTDAARTSTFTVDDPLLQWIHDATVRTMENNLQGYPTDTPKYEKNGWTGDAAVGADMFLTDLDAAPVLRKWVQDLAETVRPGHPPDLTAPNAGVFGVDERAPVWHSALVTVPWDVYRHTGDAQLLARHVDVIEQYARFELERSPGGIADTILGDWVAPGTDPGGGNPPEDSRVPATAFLVRILDTTAAIDRVLGRDSSAFTTAAEAVRSAFVDAFVRDGVVVGEHDAGFRQSHQVLALAFDVVRDPAVRQRIADALAADVRARGDHLDTGAIGTKWLLPVLSDAGHADVALAVARQTTPPSWGAWWEAGATTMFEHWDLAARSHGHYFLGTADDWLTGYVAGIRPTGAGWSEFTVAPAVCGPVGSAAASVRTPFGPAAVRWSVSGGEVTLHVTVPFGTQASVTTPDGVRRRAAPGTHTFRSLLSSALLSGQRP